MTLEDKDLALLNKPFVASDHKFLNDLIYLHEEPINERLDSVDPAWSFQIKSIVTRDNAGEGGKDIGTVTVHASLIIKGVARDGVGMAVIQRTNPIKESLWDKAQNRKVETGVIYTSEANEAEKSAATDALKRCARMFGIGRYMLTIPKGAVKDEKQLAKWLKEVYGDFQALAKPVYHDEVAAPDPLALETHLGAPVIHETGEIKVVEIRLSDKKKPYIVAGGTTLFSRQPFRDLGYEDDFIELLAEPKKAVYLPDAIVIGYTEITVENQKQRTPVKVCRVSTGQIAEIQHTAKA